MSGWLKDAGLTRSAIGYFGSVFAVYAINFYGHPRLTESAYRFCTSAWAAPQLDTPCRVLILICTLFIAGVNPATNLMLTSMLALGIAIASATQDIAVDAFRIDTFPKSESSKLPQASAMAVIGWWTGYSVPGHLAFINADSMGWNGVFSRHGCHRGRVDSALPAGCEPNTNREALQKQAEQRHNKVVQFKDGFRLSVTVLEPFIDFRRNGTSFCHHTVVVRFHLRLRSVPRTKCLSRFTKKSASATN